MTTAVAVAVIALPIAVSTVKTAAPQTGRVPVVTSVEQQPYSLQHVHEYARQVLPLVEQAAGRKLKDLPSILVVTRREYVDEMVQPVQSRSNSKADSGPSSRRPDPKQYEPLANYIFGAYDPKDNEIYLLPENFKPRLMTAGVPERFHAQILKMVVAHELTHALQRQETSSKARISGRRSHGQYFAQRAMIEGHATFVMNQVARKLGIEEAISQFEKTLAVGLTISTDPKDEAANEEYRPELRSAYLDGEKFIRWHYEHGGNDRVWEIFRNPPTDKSMILRPETYVPAARAGRSR